MRLASFKQRHGHGHARLGIVLPDGIVDLSEAAPSLPSRMVDLIAGGAALLEVAARAAARHPRLAMDNIRLQAPIPDPPEFLGIGLNYHDHRQEAQLDPPEIPTVFNKQVSSITGPTDSVHLPSCSDQLDYEGELGFVVGQAGRHLDPKTAGEAIFGYLVVNDLSVRDWQFRSPTVTLGKSFDTHGPIGPWIVTADEIGDPQTLSLTTHVNGVLRQHSSTANMIFTCAQIVSFLSGVMTLKPGTIVTTGTPAGVGHFHAPPLYLRAGDVCAVEISGIGRLANLVVPETIADR